MSRSCTRDLLTLPFQVDVRLGESSLLQEPSLNLSSLLLRFDRVVFGVNLPDRKSIHRPLPLPDA